MPDISSIKQFVIKARWKILGIVLCLILAAGGFYGWKHYTHINSPEYFIEQLNTALVTNDLAKLAVLVDFRSVTDDMVKHIQRADIPKRPATAKEERVIPLTEEIQVIFMEALKNKDAAPPTTQEKQNPLAPLDPLPIDFAAQISGKIKLQAALGNEAVASVTVNYPRLERDFRLLFFMTKSPDWIIKRMSNVDEILRYYVTEENKLELLREEKFLKDNAIFQQRMDEQFELRSCTAFVHAATGSKTKSLFVRIKGYNKGPQIIRNMTFETTITSDTAQGNVVLKEDLNMAARILPGVDLEDAYNIELDPNNAEHAAVLNTKNLFCVAKPRVMTLNNGDLLFTRKNRLEARP